jgi:dihydrofolate synthase/folylpolyglutamate synthase
MNILVSYLKKASKSFDNFYVVLGILGDKNIQSMVKNLNFSDKVKLSITKNEEKRAVAPEIIQGYAEKEEIDYEVYSNVDTALKNSLKSADKNDMICVTGSLYTVAEAKEILG